MVDDHLLLRILLRDEPRDLFVAGSAKVCTTGLFYHRLCRAANNPRQRGPMSGRLGGVRPAVAAATIKALVALPDTVALVSMRELAWPMAQILSTGVRLNLMSLEALAAAEHQGAELCLAATDSNPQLLAAAEARGTPARIVGG